MLKMSNIYFHLCLQYLENKYDIFLILFDLIFFSIISQDC